MSVIYDYFHRAATRFPDKLALVDAEDTYTYAQLLAEIETLACKIIDKSGQQRPRVALITDNQKDNICTCLAIAKLNGCCIPMNGQLLPAQLIRACQAVDANILAGSAGAIQKTAQAKHAIATIDLSAVDLSAVSQNNAEISQGNNRVSAELDARIASWQGAQDFLITLSSGSTGAPKPIMISQQVKLERAKQSWELYHLTERDVSLCASPFFHSLGQRLTFVPLLLGCTMVHLGKFTPSQWLNLVEQYQVSFVISVSSHLYALKKQLIANAKQLTSLNTIVTSSAPIDAKFKAQVFNAIGCDFHEIYGATEIAVATNLSPAQASAKYQTVGSACNNIDLVILDDEYKEVTKDTVGEIAVRTPLAFSGYYQQQVLTQQSFHKEYFLTGDLGEKDADGFLSYVGRKKDIIISGGINIYPKDIESVLLQHSAIHEIAVIGVEDTLLGEVIVAICIAEPNTIESKKIESELRKLANKQLAAFQRPLKYFFPDELPLTATGKVSKLMLREQYSKLNDGWTDSLRMMLYGGSADD
ncbi:long-chain fatty acid--CoA ligase [Shewanella maritima]|uniref:Long-chain fatty acid--CoA ligase n=1 Tax=Shewanella maritima TaxID=2520507 RepID=A0A411PKG2_9GAMM|nr:class I adenylate-forming enzyme family protein [Shewanella maritima]QBF84007.1 long-chain fatty acid--CoA ligase [Shewanella maritima]